MAMKTRKLVFSIYEAKMADLLEKELHTFNKKMLFIQ